MTTEELTWDILVELEPKLQTLYEQALVAQAPLTIGSDDPWFGPKGLRAQFMKLVGPLASAHPLLGTIEAYSLVFDKLLKAFIEPPPKT